MSNVIDQQDLEQLALDVVEYVEGNDDQSTVQRGRSFLVWTLSELFELTGEQIQRAIIDGAGDNQIDAFFEDFSSLVIVQGKFNNHTSANLESFCRAVQRLREGILTSDRQDVWEVVQLIRKYEESGRKVRFVYVTNEVVPDKDMFRTADDRDKTGVEVLDLSGIAWAMRAKREDVPTSIKHREVRLQMSSFCRDDEEEVMCGFLPLADVAGLIQECGTALFDQNVRKFRGWTAVNKGMLTTLETAPTKFVKYNLGLTIVCSKVTISEDGTAVYVVAPQVVNGCQTSYTIFEYCRRTGKWDLPGKVQVKILVEEEPEERKRVTTCANSSNPVRTRSFLSLEASMKELQKRVAKYHYFMEVQSGDWTLMGAAKRAEYRGTPALNYLLSERSFKISGASMLQCYVTSFLQKPTVAAASSGDFMPGGPLWDEYFASAPKKAMYYLFPQLVFQYSRKLGYRTKGADGYKARGKLFFTYTYFRLLTKWCQANGFSKGPPADPMSIPENLLRTLFANSEANMAMLGATDELLEAYFDDTTVEDYANGNPAKFLTSTFGLPVEDGKKTPLEILDKYIARQLKTLAKNESLKSFLGSLNDQAA